MISPRLCLATPKMGRRKLLAVFVTSLMMSQVQAADLLEITQDALDKNAELASAKALFKSVEAGRDVQQADLLPQVTASGQIAHKRQYESQQPKYSAGNSAGGASLSDDSVTAGNLTLEATQALFNARSRAEVEQAERQIDQQLYQLAATEQQLLIDVSTAYFEILRANEVLDARIAQQRAIERQYEQAREQFDVGLIAITDVEEAKARFDQSRAQRIIAESALQVSFETLHKLTGKRYSSIDMLQTEMPVVPPSPSSVQEWVDLAMQRNPLVLASQAGVEVSRSGVDIARAQRLPVVEAFANYTYGDSDSDVLTGHDSSSQVGVGVSVPLFTGGRTSASIRQGTYQLASSQYDFEAQRLTAVQQVRSQFTQASNNVATVEALGQTVVSSQSALDATRAGFEVGTRNIVDVLDAEQNLYNAVADYADARYRYVTDLLALRQQSGTLDTEAISELNSWLNSAQQVQLDQQPIGAPSMDIGAPPSPDA
ncbi:TolC family outer membrane protein [Halomonas halocynthiae]|uniref:TolC family outer membrane protein n=1 Tax=Halomonas halocynthiae TaxID=176290 RepID=UPI00040FA9AB|nr:TolC family outer membrane protein [Halomonas halocynthiae]